MWESLDSSGSEEKNSRYLGTLLAVYLSMIIPISVNRSGKKHLVMIAICLTIKGEEK
jgi:hypothetical protein